MELLDAAGVVLLLCCLALLSVVWRRAALRRSGASIDLAMRCVEGAIPGQRGGGDRWTIGLARYSRDQLEWFRLFSLSPRPSAAYPRAALEVRQRRRATAGETLALMSGAVVVSCGSPSGPVELAMTESAVTGFLAWLEAAPPGATVSAFTGT